MLINLARLRRGRLRGEPSFDWVFFIKFEHAVANADQKFLIKEISWIENNRQLKDVTLQLLAVDLLCIKGAYDSKAFETDRRFKNGFFN